MTITLNGRSYRLACSDGDEPRLIELADVVRAKLDHLVGEYGQAGDDRLLLMSALMIADELLDARGRVAAMLSPPPMHAHQPPHLPSQPQATFAAEAYQQETFAPAVVTDALPVMPPPVMQPDIDRGARHRARLERSRVERQTASGGPPLPAMTARTSG